MRRVVQLVATRVNCHDYSYVDDCVQHGVAEALARSPEDPVAYATTIAKNAMRSGQLWRFCAINAMSEWSSVAAKHSDIHEVIAALEQSLQAMPERYAKAITLSTAWHYPPRDYSRDGHGFERPVENIAIELGYTYDTTREYITRARRRLRSDLKDVLNANA